DSIRAIVKLSFIAATEILKRNRDVLNRCAEQLLQKETLTEAELKELTSDLVHNTDSKLKSVAT
ncbi:MAG: hypothetical protein OER96_05820, partial [Gammaproteobacteria bacterium]|nr:hypothetical protein [Gammaproteobacteria bacterium]